MPIDQRYGTAEISTEPMGDTLLARKEIQALDVLGQHFKDIDLQSLPKVNMGMSQNEVPFLWLKQALIGERRYLILRHA